MGSGFGLMPMSIKTNLAGMVSKLSQNGKKISELLIYGNIYKLTDLTRKGIDWTIDLTVKSTNYVILLV
ncbi:hypothetical protein HHI36_012815 [Cryptolaemus montrouzieri]|uniref:Uncharacterized protein n=1 Tax=Cryptolaemus montrouzieri TaxID=559131 RepID=A0ABD2NFU1_9CUCU